MAGHRRKWLIASALLVIVASMTWLVTRSGPRVTLELAFVGYTNKTLVHSNVLSSHGPVSFTSIEQTAQVLATNCGAVPLKFNTKVSSLDYVTIDGVWVFRGTLAMPLGSNAPNVLEPGECGIIEISSRNFEYRWSTEVLARPYRLRDRMADTLAKVPGAAMQKLSRKLSSSRNGVLYKLDTVTNRPPGQPRLWF